MTRIFLLLLAFAGLVSSFISPRPVISSNSFVVSTHPGTPSTLYARDKLSPERRKKLGVADDEDEYDLGQALNANTDPLISKIIAGSFILVMVSLLVVGVVLPSLTDYGEGVCNPILTRGRC
jgi:hypothetical protein